MFMVNPSTPCSTPITPQRFGFTKTMKGIAVNIANQQTNFLNHLIVLRKPIIKFFERQWRKADLPDAYFFLAG